MTLTQNQADAFRWLADGKKVEGACFDKHQLAVKVNAANISNLLLNGYIFRLAQETITATMPKPSGIHQFDAVRIILLFDSTADRDAALAAIRKEME